MIKISMLLVSMFLFPFDLFASPCPPGEHWVTGYFKKAHTRYDGTKVKASHVKSYCRTNPRGYKQWHQRLSNSRPKIWGYKNEKSKKWTTEDTERVLDALSILPDQLINLENVKIYRMEKSKFPENPATTNHFEITLYNYAFQHKDSLAQILSHELAHVLIRTLTKNDIKAFVTSADWIQNDFLNKTYYQTSDKKEFIQKDSKVSIKEDFANHVEYYLFKPNFLNRKSSKAYKWIKQKYGKNFKIRKKQ